ncbi:hypothetical protein [Anaeromyxobacter sp. PSR-1]|uniref:hypothetical protein n=1 Tax=Anaeromyxobacter sp. PSR-1 TaxID=1300915 RepID=UPI0009E2A1EC|nr:hypothetical protein [Anaeromyxobacter sp. PSR-1]
MPAHSSTRAQSRARSRAAAGSAGTVRRAQARSLEVPDGAREGLVPAARHAEQLEVEVLERQVLLEQREQPRAAQAVLAPRERDARRLEDLQRGGERSEEPRPPERLAAPRPRQLPPDRVRVALARDEDRARRQRARRRERDDRVRPLAQRVDDGDVHARL